jgi:hypothetical protein
VLFLALPDRRHEHLPESDVNLWGSEAENNTVRIHRLFYKKGGVDVHYGCFFPTGWDQTDWIGYDYTITRAIQTWIKCGRKLEEEVFNSVNILRENHFIKVEIVF